MKAITRLFKCGANQDDKYFDAAGQNNCIYVQQHINCTGRYDQRKTNLDNNIFNGIAAIHYSVLNNALNVFKLLYNYESHLLTKNSIQADIPALEMKTIDIPAGTDILELSILLQRDDIIVYMLQQRYEIQQHHLTAMAQLPLRVFWKPLIMSKMQIFILTPNIDYGENDFTKPETYLHSVTYNLRNDHLCLILEYLINNMSYELICLLFGQLQHMYNGGKTLQNVLNLQHSYEVTFIEQKTIDTFTDAFTKLSKAVQKYMDLKTENEQLAYTDQFKQDLDTIYSYLIEQQQCESVSTSNTMTPYTVDVYQSFDIKSNASIGQLVALTDL